ncbi:MAG: hypothetical protein GXY70_01115 [Euryarchaeota archaeon]|nr:hypothetical protein [Euryarchaeota archaeon]
MVKVRMARKGDLHGLGGKDNTLGGPSFSSSALEMLMREPGFDLLVAEASGILVHHEGAGGSSRVLLLTGKAAADLLKEAEGLARRAGAAKIVLEAAPDGPALTDLESAGYSETGTVPDHFARGRPALLFEKRL